MSRPANPPAPRPAFNYKDSEIHTHPDFGRELRADKKARQPKRPAVDISKLDRLPPHSIEAEQGVLGCCLLAPPESIAKAIEKGCLSGWFYDLRHQTLWLELIEMHAKRTPIDLISFQQRLKDRKHLDTVGGLAYVSSLMDAVPSAANLGYYLDIVGEKFRLRAGAQAATEFLASIHEEQGDPGPLLKEFAARMKVATEDEHSRATPLIEFLDEDSIRAHVKDPTNYLVGASLIKRGQWSALAGWWGLGKSRLAHALAIAGARGEDWQGYAIPRPFRTYILQSEDDEDRIQDELMEALKGTKNWIRISRPTALNFKSEAFIRELRAQFDQWPFDLLQIDPWTDVAGAAEMEDVQLAMMRLQEAFHGVAKKPAVLAVAHLRKQKGGESWRPKRASELVHDVAGSYGLVAKARTVFTLQPHSMDDQDGRVVFGVGKSNNQIALPMSCWHRGNGVFTPDTEFDLDDWMHPADGAAKRRAIPIEDVVKALGKRAGMPRHELVKKMMELGHSSSTVYRAIDPGGYLNPDLIFAAGVVSLRK